MEAAKLGGQSPPRVVVSACRAGEGRGAVVVQDTGSGPAESVADRIGEAFITSKPDGVGLGLFVARQIAESHRGGLRWERNDGWTCFRFEFPLRQNGDSPPEFKGDCPRFVLGHRERAWHTC